MANILHHKSDDAQFFIKNIIKRQLSYYMICQIQNTDQLIPLYKTYLDHMIQYYENITDFESWKNKALKNLKKRTGTKDSLIYIIKESQTIIGFTIVSKRLRFNREGLAIAEFNIALPHQKKGYGTKLAQHVFSQAPGNWEIAVASKNHRAKSFWKKVVSDYTSGKYHIKTNTSNNMIGFIFKK